MALGETAWPGHAHHHRRHCSSLQTAVMIRMRHTVQAKCIRPDYNLCHPHELGTMWLAAVRLLPVPTQALRAHAASQPCSAAACGLTCSTRSVLPASARRAAHKPGLYIASNRGFLCICLASNCCVSATE